MKIEYSHQLTSDQKLALWGYGEWVEEAEECFFEVDGITCTVARSPLYLYEDLERFTIQHLKENNLFGGYFNCFCEFPENHPFSSMRNGVLEVEELPWDEKEEDVIAKSDNAIGMILGCNERDYMPSQIKMGPYLNLTFEEGFFLDLALSTMDCGKSVYRNMDYAINKCKKMVHIIKETENTHT